MNEERKIETEQVDAVSPPPRARVAPETAADTFERKRDYLAGFLSGEIGRASCRERVYLCV